MKTLRLIVSLLVVLFAGSVSAQTSITTTTLTNAITNPTPTTINIVVGSATGFAARGILYIDGSVYRIADNYVSGTTVPVINQYRRATHAAAVTIYVVPVGAQIGLNPVGSCLRGTSGLFPQYSPYTLMFNLATGDVARCSQPGIAAGVVGTWFLSNPYSVGAPSTTPPITP